jgi:hypothetical protein
MMWLPFMLTLNILRLPGLTVGEGAVQVWMLCPSRPLSDLPPWQ